MEVLFFKNAFEVEGFFVFGIRIFFLFLVFVLFCETALFQVCEHIHYYYLQ